MNFRKKEMKTTHANELKRNLQLKDLIMLGIGAIIGTGIFVITGVPDANHAGPALTLSFILAAVVVGLSGLCFAEFSARIPVIGGPYAYMYVVFGEIAAWFTGWFLICEFLLAVSSVASGWSGYMQGFLGSWGIHLPKALTAGYNAENGTYIDLIAALVIVFITFWVSQEAKKALRLNNAMVWVKFFIIILFIAVGIFYIKPNNWTPFMPNGVGSVFRGSSLVFFAFLGFDSVAMAAEEVKNPQKDVPKGIIGSIGIATILYIIVTLISTGVVPFAKLQVSDPMAFVMRYAGHGFLGSVISVGAILTLLTVTISMMYSLARLLYAISKDGLLPKQMQKIDQKTRTPKNATFVAGGFALFFAAAFPLQILAELTNIAALVYLMMVSGGILKLRKEFGKPEKGQFAVPLVPVLPIFSVLACIFLIAQFSLTTYIVFAVTLLLGFAIYFFYGYRNSEMNKK